MTEEQILAERALLYARVEEVAQQSESRCLRISLDGRSWLFPEQEIALLLAETRTSLPQRSQAEERTRATELPPGVRWGGLPCCGLIQHSLSALPLVCWSRLLTGVERSWNGEYDILLLRSAPLALRVPAPVEMVNAGLGDARSEGRPWSRGELGDDTSIADLGRLAGEGR